MLSFRKLAFLALACCICLATPQARAQAPSAPSSTGGSAVIGEIHATGSRRYTEAQVAAATGLKPGDTVTREQLQALAQLFFQTDQIAATVLGPLNGFTLTRDRLAC